MATAEPSWTRLEPSPRDPSMATGLRAEVHDPLWLLARQLQFGELHAQDAGSPVWVELDGEVGRLTRYRPGPADGGPGRPWDGDQPLEELVEAEPEGEHPLRLAAAAGLHFLMLLDQEQVGSYAAAYLALARYRLAADPAIDPTGGRFLAVLAGRTLDGVTLYRDLVAADPALPAEPAIAPGDDTAAVHRAADRFRAWYQALAGPTQPSAWVPARLEYQLNVAGPLPTGEVVLTASEYDQGRLDWSAFDLAAEGASLGAAADPAGPTDLRRAGLPVPVVYRGMPAARFWQFEDAAVDFGDLSAAPEDLTRLLLVEFATVYGNDHFVVAVDLGVGSLCRIRRLVVTDSFGGSTEVPHVATADADADRTGTFRLFELGAGSVRSPLFLLAPTLGTSLNGPPVEAVRLLRDEGANLAWAVEAIAAPGGGFPVDRAGSGPAQPASEPPPDHGEPPAWRYRLRTPVPDAWFPLVPIADRPGVNHLELGSLPSLGGTPPPTPWGRILAELDGVTIPEEEVSRAATTVTRAWQYTRWIDGHQHAWVGRRRGPANDSGDSGLRFDTLEPPSQL
jgi:hypothetical protein